MSPPLDSLYEQALSASGIGAFQWHAASGRLRYNEALAELLGWDVRARTPDWRDLLAAIRVEDRVTLEAALEDARRHGRALRQTLRLRTPGPDGERRIVLRAFHAGDAGAGTLTVSGLVADVTQRDERQRALLQSEARHRLLFDANPVPLLLADAATKEILQANAAAAELLGTEAAALRSRALDEVFGDGQDYAAAAAWSEIGPDISHLGILSVRHRDGTKRYVEVTVDQAELGGTLVTVVAAVDVSARLASEQALREALDALRSSTERLDLALAATSDGLWDTDFSTGETYVNAAWWEMLGYSPHELPASLATWERLTHPEDIPRVFAALAEHNADGSSAFELEIRMRRKDGSWAWILDRGQVINRDAAGKPRRVIGTHTDISHLRAQRDALAQQATLLDTVLSNIPIALDIVGTDGRFEYVNRALVELLGWSLDEMQREDVFALVFPDPEYRAGVMRSIVEASSVPRDWEMLTRDGRRITCTWSNVRLPDGRIIGIGQDVTALRAAQREQALLQGQLEQTQKLESLGVLAGGIAHDFNNLLVGVLGNASLAEGMLPQQSPVGPVIADIRAAATRAAELTRQLLAYAGKGSFVVESVDLSRLVREMAALLGAAISKRATLVPTLGEDLPPVLADATQLRQIVMNLITNASEAIGDVDGVIEIRSGQMDDAGAFRRTAIGGDRLPEGPLVFLEVRDTGHGMDAATVERIFDPFFSTKFTGRGLGLAATLGIIRSHRGAIDVRSAPGKGTTIRLLLPAAERRPEVGPQPRNDAPTPAAPLHGEVLVADDDAMVRSIATRLLQQMGFTVVACADGAEALERFRERPDAWQLVFLDLTMPRLDGSDALIEMRKLRGDVPAVLCSGYTPQSLPEDLTSRPQVRFLQKPYAAAALHAAVRDVIGPGTP